MLKTCQTFPEMKEQTTLRTNYRMVRNETIKFNEVQCQMNEKALK